MFYLNVDPNIAFYDVFDKLIIKILSTTHQHHSTFTYIFYIQYNCIHCLALFSLNIRIYVITQWLMLPKGFINVYIQFNSLRPTHISVNTVN